ncbi:MAG: putative TesA-like protein protease [Candidatus Saccharibacteria bacterium]|nr:putative TesA-like protein protease [Candidatus Saccharibacteria bacterium]
MAILIFGDSITAADGWVAKIRQNFKDTENEFITVYNLGVGGDSADDLCTRFDKETQARSRYGIEAIIFAIGVNDSRVEDDVNYSNPERYQDSLIQLAHQAKKYTEKIIFVGLTPCSEERTTPVSWRNTTYTNERIKMFDMTLRDFCRMNSISYVSVFESFQEKQKHQDMLPDGIHPNDTGHQLIYNLIQPKLQELLN